MPKYRTIPWVVMLVITTGCRQKSDEPQSARPQPALTAAVDSTHDQAPPAAQAGTADHSAEHANPLSGDEALASLMEAPASVRLDDHLGRVESLAEFFEGAPVPVVDAEGRLCGLLAAGPHRPTR